VNLCGGLAFYNGGLSVLDVIRPYLDSQNVEIRKAVLLAVGMAMFGNGASALDVIRPYLDSQNVEIKKAALLATALILSNRNQNILSYLLYIFSGFYQDILLVDAVIS